jgi:hypothetical protein
VQEQRSHLPINRKFVIQPLLHELYNNTIVTEYLSQNRTRLGLIGKSPWLQTNCPFMAVGSKTNLCLTCNILSESKIRSYCGRWQGKQMCLSIHRLLFLVAFLLKFLSLSDFVIKDVLVCFCVMMYVKM